MLNKQERSDYMTDKEKKILETFKEVIPGLTERQKDRLLWIGEGISLKTEEKEKQTA